MLHLLQINRLRIMCRGAAVYDQRFHEGVNIIRGQNGSGKSTVADFIFFILGGEFDDWKDAANRCDEVHCEILTPSGKLTLRRSTESKLSPIFIYFGGMDKAGVSALDGWQRFPIRRQSADESFTQVLFRALEIPEAQSDGASNITVHQLLRLCYSDQRTPAPRLFRFESFDTQNIREAVGDLICGISGYELYEINLALRELEKRYAEANTALSGLLKALPPDDALRTTDGIYATLNDLQAEKEQLEREIKNIDETDNFSTSSEYLKMRKFALLKISSAKKNISLLEERINKTELEMVEIESYQKYLTELSEKLNFTETSLNVLGSVDFMHCPSCGAQIESQNSADCCALCKNPVDPTEEKSRYNLIRTDIELQSRESKHLIEKKEYSLRKLKSDYKILHSELESDLSNFSMKFSAANGPREAYLIDRTQRMGQINAEVEYLTRSLKIASEVDALTLQKNKISTELDAKKNRAHTLQKLSQKRRLRSLAEVSDVAVSLLHSDCKRQEEFEAAEKVELRFVDDAILVDGKMNFAESSNVFLKNTAILALFLAAGRDSAFYHPGFLLLDNIEDKGMEVERSHLFQRLIVERATALEVPFQIIFTTSMMNPALELDDYVIGPSYTRENKTLNFNSGKL